MSKQYGLDHAAPEQGHGHGHAATLIYSIDLGMNNRSGHAALVGHAAWTWTCNGHGHAAWTRTCNIKMDMQHGYGDAVRI